MAKIKLESEDTTRALFWDTNKKTLGQQVGDEIIPIPNPCKDCGKFTCVCGEAHRTATVQELTNQIVSMLTFKTTAETRNILRMVEARTVLDNNYHVQEPGD